MKQLFLNAEIDKTIFFSKKNDDNFDVRSKNNYQEFYENLPNISKKNNSEKKLNSLFNYNNEFNFSQIGEHSIHYSRDSLIPKKTNSKVNIHYWRHKKSLESLENNTSFKSPYENFFIPEVLDKSDLSPFESKIFEKRKRSDFHKNFFRLNNSEHHNHRKIIQNNSNEHEPDKSFLLKNVLHIGKKTQHEKPKKIFLN